MSEASYTIALDEARRGLDGQLDDLKSTRDRATALLGVGGLAAAFIAGLRGDEPLSGWTWTAIGAFVALATIGVVQLWPRTMTVAQDPAVLVGWADDDASVADMERDLALHMNRHFADNSAMLMRMHRLNALAAIALFIEVAGLMLDLGSL